ncbi:MAG TPA: OmpA family protein [Methylocella sp.]|nr:OmpA family protein [Methylocella sp.]
MFRSPVVLFGAILIGGFQTAAAAPRTSVAATSAAPSAPSSLLLYFDRGSATVRPKDTALLDQASRLYREGKPIVMIVSGSTDSTGSAATNLHLSQRRANNVLQGLVSRGIPIERFQVVAKGETDLAVPTAPGVSEELNRCVEITWR